MIVAIVSAISTRTPGRSSKRTSLNDIGFVWTITRDSIHLQRDIWPFKNCQRWSQRQNRSRLDRAAHVARLTRLGAISRSLKEYIPGDLPYKSTCHHRRHRHVQLWNNAVSSRDWRRTTRRLLQARSTINYHITEEKRTSEWVGERGRVRVSAWTDGHWQSTGTPGAYFKTTVLPTRASRRATVRLAAVHGRDTTIPCNLPWSRLYCWLLAILTRNRMNLLIERCGGDRDNRSYADLISISSHVDWIRCIARKILEKFH